MLAEPVSDKTSRASVQRIVTLAVAVLDEAAYGSNKQRRDTVSVRLALSVLWLIMRDKHWLKEYWFKAANVSGVFLESCRPAHQGIKQALKKEGWQVADIDPSSAEIGSSARCPDGPVRGERAPTMVGLD